MNMKLSELCCLKNDTEPHASPQVPPLQEPGPELAVFGDAEHCGCGMMKTFTLQEYVCEALSFTVHFILWYV